LVVAGVIGGLFAFGIIGLFIGPVVLAVSHALLVAWMSESEAEPTPESQVMTGSNRALESRESAP
jgi:predicted PurR-regulated permease PerM